MNFNPGKFYDQTLIYKGEWNNLRKVLSLELTLSISKDKSVSVTKGLVKTIIFKEPWREYNLILKKIAYLRIKASTSYCVTLTAIMYMALVESRLVVDPYGIINT